MLVRKGDYLQRDGKVYCVVCADDEVFVIGRRYYDVLHACYKVSYTNLEAYSNDEAINTLKILNFSIC